jgi:hypothetical protein
MALRTEVVEGRGHRRGRQCVVVDCDHEMRVASDDQ